MRVKLSLKTLSNYIARHFEYIGVMWNIDGLNVFPTGKDVQDSIQKYLDEDFYFPMQVGNGLYYIDALADNEYDVYVYIGSFSK